MNRKINRPALFTVLEIAYVIFGIICAVGVFGFLFLILLMQ
jgi:hypothetical protein